MRGVNMPVQERLKALQRRHHEVDTDLVKEENRPAGDETMIARLKKEKLRLKDEIENLRQREELSEAVGY